MGRINERTQNTSLVTTGNTVQSHQPSHGQANGPALVWSGLVWSSLGLAVAVTEEWQPWPEREREEECEAH